MHTTFQLKAWVHAARLRTLPLALSGILLAGFIAYSQQTFKWDVCVLAAITTLLLQILSNFANDYGDFSHGTDNEKRVGPERAVQSGAISPKQMKTGIYLTGTFALITGITLLLRALNGVFNYIFILFFIIGVLAIGAAIKYTVGKRNFGYKGFGDLMVFIFFGIAAVLGTYFLNTLSFDWWVLLPASAIGLLSTGVLNVNNMRDIDNDKISGKNTIAVKLGVSVSKIYHFVLVGLAILCILSYAFFLKEYYLLISLAFPSLLLVFHLIKVLKAPKQKDLDPELKRLSLATLFISLWLGIGLIL